MTPVIAPEGVPILIFDSVYTEPELAVIWEELKFFTNPRRMFGASITGAATGDNGQFKKTATGVFLDKFYVDRNSSDILEINRKLFSTDVYKHAASVSPFFNLLEFINKDFTLVNYYDDSQSYEAHKDSSVFTAITVFYKEPTQFAGGDWEFPEFDFKVEKRNNRTVIFPGSLEHAVTPIAMQNGHAPFSGYGRYAMVQFMHIVP